MPYRHRHPVAGPPRRADDRAGLLPASLAEARSLAARTGSAIEFVESDVYKACEVLPKGAFDLVYTGIGALCWLPSVDTWARNVSQLLKPGGRLFIREGHPMLWALDESHEDALVVDLPYFERSEPLVWDDDSTYASTDRPLKATVTHAWNHGLGKSSARCSSTAWTSAAWWNTRASPGKPCPGRCAVTNKANGTCNTPLGACH